MVRTIQLLITVITILSILSLVHADENVDFFITNISQIEFFPAESASLAVTYENIGTGTAYDLISEINTEGLPIRNLGDSTRYTEYVEVSPLSKNYTTVTYNVYVDELADEGIYVIPLTLLWKTESRSSRIKTYEISVRVAGAKNIGKLDVSTVKTQPDIIAPGSIFNVTFDLINVGEADANKISLNLIPSYPFSSIGNIPSVFISTLKPNQKATVNFSLGVDSSANAGLYSILTNLEYFSKDVKISLENNSFGVIIVESVGILDISNVTIKKEIIQPGDIFEIELSPKNLGTHPINDLSIKLIPKPPFGTIKGVPEAYIRSLNPNDVGNAKFKISVDRIAPSRQFYPMDFEVEYKSQNKKYEKNGTFNIIVKGEPTLYIQEIIVEPTKLTAGSEGLMLIRLINTGTERAEDLTIRVSGGENILTESYRFIGGLEINDLETSSFGIYVDPNLKSGIYALDMDISYKDRYGNYYSSQKTSEISIFKSSSLITYIFVLGGFLGVSVLIFIIVVTAKGWMVKK
ncbi:MAG: COG1361 S-layer family protein [Candidatus Hodarchaeales archaeon]|jgi:hypothetical protein